MVADIIEWSLAIARADGPELGRFRRLRHADLISLGRGCAFPMRAALGAAMRAAARAVGRSSLRVPRRRDGGAVRVAQCVWRSAHCLD